MTNALYIGAGTDILPVLLNPDIKNFIYIDSQPMSEFGMLGFEDKTFYRKNFLENLSKIMRNNNFKLKENTNNYLRYYNETTNQTINYHINTVVPEKLTQNLINSIKTCDVLFCIGHDPHKIIMDYIQKPFVFIGSVSTSYSKNRENYEEPDKSLFLELYSNSSLVSEYKLIKDKKYYEYWKHDKINNKIINNFDIVKYNNLEELEKARKKVFDDFYVD
jgi:hypothetical protein